LHDCAAPIANPSVTTIYYVTVKNADGCLDMDSIIIEVDIICGKDIFVPMHFLPMEIITMIFCMLTVQTIVLIRGVFYWKSMIAGATKCFLQKYQRRVDGKYKQKEMNTEVFRL